MELRKHELYLVTVKTPWSVYEDTIEAESLQRAALAGVSRRFGSGVDPETWTRSRGPSINAHRLLSLHSPTPSIRVTAEALTY